MIRPAKPNTDLSKETFCFFFLSTNFRTSSTRLAFSVLVRVGETNQSDCKPGVTGKGLREKIERDKSWYTLYNLSQQRHFSSNLSCSNKILRKLGGIWSRCFTMERSWPLTWRSVSTWLQNGGRRVLLYSVGPLHRSKILPRWILCQL